MGQNRFCSTFGVDVPVMLAPMAGVSGGRLAAAVSAAGGLGVVGGGYGDHRWLREELANAAGQRVGCGFITWSLRQDPSLLAAALGAGADPIMLSFGDPGEFIPQIRDAGRKVVLQVHSVAGAAAALDLDIDAVVAQGDAAGGHGTGQRSTFTLVPEVAGLVADRRPGLPLLAAGGIVDGRGLAAALVLGADAVLMGTRFWSSREALVSPAAQRRAAAAGGDETVRSGVFDGLRGRDWPAGYGLRTLGNDTTRRWRGREDELRAMLPEARDAYERAVATEDFDTAAVIVGEGVGQVRDAPPVAALIAGLRQAAAAALGRATDLFDE